MFAVVGLSHHTAPIEVRERMALEREQIEALLKQLVAQPEIEEALVLSTCNRVEVMAAARSGVEAERLDRAVRAQMSAQHEAASKRLSQASIDAARVLTPEQRAKIAEVMKKRQARMAGRHPG